MPRCLLCCQARGTEESLLLQPLLLRLLPNAGGNNSALPGAARPWEFGPLPVTPYTASTSHAAAAASALPASAALRLPLPGRRLLPPSPLPLPDVQWEVPPLHGTPPPARWGMRWGCGREYAFIDSVASPCKGGQGAPISKLLLFS